MSISTAEQFEDNEQFDKAYEEYKQVYLQKPKSIEIMERLGHLAMILDKKNEAEVYYQKILELDMTNVMAHEQLMDIYFHTNKYKYYVSRGNLHVLEQQLSHAINDYKKALDKTQTEEEMVSTRFVLANLYEQTGKTHQAIDEYLRILDAVNANEMVYLKLANVYLMENALASAIETLERAKEKGIETEAINENLAQFYLRNNQPEKARGLTNDGLLQAKSFLDEGKNKEAFDILEKIKEKNFKNADYHQALAQYYFNIKDFEKGINSVDEFDKLKPNSPLTYQMRALIFEEQGKDFDSHINWAKYYLSRNDKEVALNEYFSAYQVNDKDTVLIRNIAELLEDLKDKHQAIEFYEKLIALDSRNKKALEKLAEFKENIGDYRSQAEMLVKLYEIDIRNAAIVKKLAQTYERIKNKDKALEFYNKFIKISPVNDEYEQVQIKIKKLENTAMEEDEGLIGKIMKMFSK